MKFTRFTLGLNYIRENASLNNILRNARVLFSGQVIASLLLLLQSVIITRSLGVDLYGVFVLVIAYALLINQLVDSRVWETVIKYVTEALEQDDHSRAAAVLKFSYLIDALTAIIALVILLLSSELAARIFVKDASMAYLFRLYSFSLVLSIPFGVSSAVLRIGDRFDYLSVQEVAFAAFRVITALLVALIAPSILNMILANMFSLVLRSVLIVLMARQVQNNMDLPSIWSAHLGLLRGQYRELLSFVLFTNLTATSRLVQSRGDMLILSWLTTPAVVGLYDVAKRLADKAGIFASPLYTAIYPEIARLVAARDLDQLWSLLHKLSLIMLVVVVAVCIVADVAAYYVIPQVYGPDYTGAVIIFQIFIWRLLWNVVIWFPGLMLAFGRAQLVTALSWVYTIIYFILLLLLIPSYAGLGAAMATIISTLCWIAAAIPAYALLKRRMNHGLVQVNSQIISQQV